jgi:hypothetical protein
VDIYTPRHAPAETLEGHLSFALKYEGLDLLALKSLFRATGPGPIEAIVRATPTGSYARRIWFLYERLLGTELDLPPAGKGAYALVVDPAQQWAAAGTTSSRHRVKNNLPGTPSFCPMIFRTEALRAFTARDLAERAHAFAFRGYVAYANELFGVSMRVHKNGDVEMLDDDPLGRIVRLH